MKRAGKVIGIIVVILICIGAWALFKKNKTDTDAIYIDKVNLEGDTFTTNGGFTGGAIKYAGYDYNIEGKDLDVYIKNRLFVGKNGDFTIKIKDTQLKNIENVYLQGEESSDTYQLLTLQED